MQNVLSVQDETKDITKPEQTQSWKIFKILCYLYCLQSYSAPHLSTGMDTEEVHLILGSTERNCK